MIDKINELVGNNEFEEAKKLLEEALKEDGENPELIKLSGLVSVNLEEWQNARSAFETVVKYKEDDATSWFYLGNCYDKLGDTISAKSSYIKVITLREEYIEAYKLLCIDLLKLNDAQEAINWAEKALSHNSDDYIYDFIIGTAYMKLKEFDKAIEPLESAVKKAPENLMNYNSLGTCYMAVNNFDKAIEAYQRAVEIAPENPMSYYNIGSAYQIRGNHEEACKYLKKAVEIDDEDESFKVALAMSLIKSNRFEDAALIYKKLMVQCPQKENYKYNLITCYESMGELKTAISMLEGMVYLNQKFILPAQKLASLYIRTNQLAKAKEIYDNILLKQAPNKAEIIHEYAILSSSLCDTDTAERMLKKVIKMEPGLAKAHKDLGIIYLNKRLFNYAEDEFHTAMKLQPNDFEIIFEYGNYLYSVSKNNEAERYYTEALELQPENVLALTFMALNKLILNQLDSAKEYIMKAVKINPRHEYIQFCAGRILYARKEFEEAKRYLISAVEQNPDIETKNTLALTYYELGEYQNAINIFNNILSKLPDNISTLKSIARCYEGLKDNDNALMYLEKLVSIFPEDEEAQELIRKLS